MEITKERVVPVALAGGTGYAAVRMRRGPIVSAPAREAAVRIASGALMAAAMLAAFAVEGSSWPA